eukprot:TRINITY_DN38309_c0_g1_i1.p1 TRINITY_DN38309_c0_g1~~TRINITY_DN38309_c0_g1_i1.p1  ORF type:complete len:102 (+),score=19.66 TRINITY_DN38309_c0_g1_i1:33-338(+)
MATFASGTQEIPLQQRGSLTGQASVHPAARPRPSAALVQQETSLTDLLEEIIFCCFCTRSKGHAGLQSSSEVSPAPTLAPPPAAVAHMSTAEGQREHGRRT